jgi:hypothetical protein
VKEPSLVPPDYWQDDEREPEEPDYEAMMERKAKTDEKREWAGIVIRLLGHESERTMPNQQPHHAGEYTANKEPNGAGSPKGRNLYSGPRCP